MNISIQIDAEDNQILAIYVRVNDGEVSRTVEIAEGACYADEVRNGKLLGVEILEPAGVTTYSEEVARRYPSTPRIDEFIRKAPEGMISALAAHRAAKTVLVSAQVDRDCRDAYPPTREGFSDSPEMGIKDVSAPQPIPPEVYEILAKGMEYADVFELLGGHGELLSEHHAQLEPGIVISSMTTELYEWQYSDGSAVRVLFGGGKQLEKSEYGIATEER